MLSELFACVVIGIAELSMWVWSQHRTWMSWRSYAGGQVHAQAVINMLLRLAFCGRGVLVLFAGLLRHLAHAFRGTNQAILQQAHFGMLLGCWHLPRHWLLAEVRLLSSPTSLPALRGVFALRQGDVGRERRVPSNFHLDAARPRRAVEQNQHGPRFLGMHSRGCVLSDLCKYHKAN